MLKVGVIGLGDIAQKAYLPVLAGISDTEFHFFTRNQKKLAAAGRMYRWTHLHDSLESLAGSGITGAFVHTATESHEQIIKFLLEHHIHVFVDKPISYHFETSRKLAELAAQKKLLLSVGFNRRFAPSYKFLKKAEGINMVLVQKNRKNSPDEIRRFILDDFIHVADTVRHLYPYEAEETIITGKQKDGLLTQVTLQLAGKDGTAIGIMNRDAGISEERAEVFGPAGKRIAENVADVYIHQNKDIWKSGGDDWEPTLVKRGFHGMVHNFLSALKGEEEPFIPMWDALKTHELCEKIICKLEGGEMI
ncbi:Gfo/Idh/MocA family protein [Peribacillus sp. SCS-37]|uniref:Gfo/Idh/MocA family protein n=1 Tax=Paraperibacillus esterisolvens TaxID=3115296 RepID=UPI003905AF58